MEDLHAACDKLFTEIDHLERLVNRDELDEQRIKLALSVAKRIRRDSTKVIRALAQECDNRVE